MGKKILVIDDSVQDRKIVNIFLNKAGFNNILNATSGNEGIEMAKKNKPDLIVLDTVLPDISGFQICSKIREALGGQSPKIIITTGSVLAVDALKAKKAGADDYCAKTSDCSQLVEIVKSLIGSEKKEA